MSRALWASAIAVFAVSLTPGVALAASSKSQASGVGSRHSSHNTHHQKASAGRDRRLMLAPGAGYGVPGGSRTVRLLQRRLLGLGISPGPVDGRYGPLTVGALQRFQRQHGLVADGIVGPRTRQALSSGSLFAGAGYLQPHGSQAVRSLQRRLARAGFSPGRVDGRYGPQTERAVRRFQKAHRLAVDGITGTRTQDALGGSATHPAGRPKRAARPHGRTPRRTPQPKPATPRQPHKASPGRRHHAPAPSIPKTTGRHHGGHGTSIVWLIVIALAAILIAALLALLGVHTRRRRTTRPAEATVSPELTPLPEPVPAPEPAPEPVAKDAGPAAPGTRLASEPGVSEPESGPEPSPPRPQPPEPVPVPVPLNGEVEPSAVPSNGEPERSALASNGEPERSASNGDPDRLRRVMALQNQLAALGFEPGPIDGRFGPVTMDAVRRLQEAHGLEADGIVGPLTAEVLRQSAPEPPSNERAERIKALQHQLSWLGLGPGPADGRYGPLTTGAVKRFQEAHDLPVDGIVDRSTADALRASIAQRPSSNRIDRVSALQRQLVWLGLQPGPVDGRYGPRTAEAVMRFQEDHDLPADGVVGPDTQKALEQSIQQTSQW